MEEPPTALFAGRNVICTGAVLALQQAGLSHQVALIGFDEVAVGEFVQPRITVVRQDTHAIGTHAIDRLLARLDGDQSPAAIEVIPRPSCSAGPGRSSSLVTRPTLD